MMRAAWMLVGLVLGVVLTLLVVPAAPAEKAMRPPQAPDIVSRELLSERPAAFPDGSRPTSWDVAGISDPAGLRAFIRDLQRAVRDDNRSAVASMVHLSALDLASAEAFDARYEELMSEQVRAALAGADLKHLWRNYQGVMLGHGELWIRQTSGGFRVVALNP